jgi:hypothetical protein
VTKTELSRFDEQGYLVVNGVLDIATDVEPVFEEYGQLLDGLAHALCAEGAIPHPFEDLPFLQRLVEVSQASGRSLGRYFSPTLPEGDITKDTPMHQGSAVFNLLTNPRVLDVVESVIGPEIFVNPLHHLRLKLPRRAVHGQGDGLVAGVPWHQDSGVLQPEADPAALLTVWIPMTEATEANGALEVAPGSHRAEGDVLFHCPADIARGLGPYIPDQMIPTNRVPVPMEVGSILLLHKRTIHRSLDNKTENEVRLSFDLRYQRVGDPTGRPGCPGFVARSNESPQSVLRDAAKWKNAWELARDQLAADQVGMDHFFRWLSTGPGCA